MRPTAMFLGCMYVGFAVLSALSTKPVERELMLPVFASAAAGFLIEWVLLGGGRSLGRRRLTTIAGLMACVPTGTNFLALSQDKKPTDAMWIILTIVATGALLRSTAWFLGIAAASFAGYGFVATTVGFTAVWIDCAIGLVGALLLGVVLHLVVRRTTVRLDRARADLVSQATTDALPALPNRHALPALFERASASGEMALLFIDVDGLKVVNDTDGHEAGDALIVGVGHALQHGFRGDDTVVRVGGDEFVLLLPGASEAQGETFAARAELICSAVAPHGISVGVAASTPGEPPSLDALLSDADTAMYVRKEQRRAGRDQPRRAVPALGQPLAPEGSSGR